jgi:membrane-associated phospholipid phosphatase
VLWVCYPRFRHIYLIVAMLCAAGLVAANYHFVGDVIGGAFLGVTSAMLADRGWNLWRRRRRSVSGRAGDEPRVSRWRRRHPGAYGR